MRFTPFALIALFAPLPAAAFGNLDCITFQSCDVNSLCAAQTTPFAIDFDWANEQALVGLPDDTFALPWIATGQSDDGLASVLEYATEGDATQALRIEASGMDIIAYLKITTLEKITWTALCDVRSAA